MELTEKLETGNLIIYSDGGSRGNPGPAACGAVVFEASGKELQRLSRTIGITTNNQAEYQALEMALKWVKESGFDKGITCRLDSELVVKQLNGEYKMKNMDLKTWFYKVKELVVELGGSVWFEHIPREKNKIADYLVNEALDASGN